MYSPPFGSLLPERVWVVALAQPDAGLEWCAEPLGGVWQCVAGVNVALGAPLKREPVVEPSESLMASLARLLVSIAFRCHHCRRLAV